MAVPFIYQYQPDPEDYFRFTHAALIRLGKISGFKTIKIYILSEGIFTTLGEKMVNLLIPGRLKYLKSLVRTIILTINIVADRFIKIIIPYDYFFKLLKRFPLGYLVVYEKREN